MTIGPWFQGHPSRNTAWWRAVKDLERLGSAFPPTLLQKGFPAVMQSITISKNRRAPIFNVCKLILQKKGSNLLFASVCIIFIQPHLHRIKLSWPVRLASTRKGSRSSCLSELGHRRIHWPWFSPLEFCHNRHPELDHPDRRSIWQRWDPRKPQLAVVFVITFKNHEYFVGDCWWLFRSPQMILPFEPVDWWLYI